MQDSKINSLIFVRFEKQRFADANFSGGELILIGQFLLLDHWARLPALQVSML